MNETINPEALKKVRGQLGLSQKDLAEKSNCSLSAIGRWETGKFLSIQKSSRERLVKALNSSWEELSNPPQENQNTNRITPAVKLTALVRPDTRTALEMVQLMFGVSRATIIELAPLLFLITAQSSLEQRKKNIDRFNEMLEQIKNEGKDSIPHIAEYIEYLGMGADEGTWAEEKSIAKRKLFGPFDSEGDDNSDPYTNYLKNLVEQMSEKLVDNISPADYGDSPRYRISNSYLKKVTGIGGFEEADNKLLDYIEEGQISLRQVISKKDSLSEEDYKEWLSTKLVQTTSSADNLDHKAMGLMREGKKYSEVVSLLEREEGLKDSAVEMEDFS